MHAKIHLLGSTAGINAVIAAAVSNGVTIAGVDLTISDGDTLDGLTLMQGNATPSTSTGNGTPEQSAPTSAAPMPTAPMPSTGSETSEDDEEGDDSDGSGLDADGLPWDERIHSGSKKRGRDGTWNKRRGGPKGDELAAIEAELRAGLMGDPAAANEAQPTAPVPAPAPTPPMPAVTAEQTQPQPVPMPAPVPPMPTATAAEESSPAPAMPATAAPAEQQQPAQPVASTDMDFPTFMQQVGPKMGEGEGQINAAYLGAVCQMHGLNSITDLALKPEMIGTIVAQFAADGRW